MPIISQTQQGDYYEVFEPELTIGTTTYTKPSSTLLGTIYVKPEFSNRYPTENYPVLVINEIIMQNIDITAKPSSGYFNIISTALPPNSTQDWYIPQATKSNTSITYNSTTGTATVATGYLTITSINWGESTSVSNTPLNPQITVPYGTWTYAKGYSTKYNTIDNTKYYWNEIATGTITATITLKTTGTNASLNIRDLRTAAALQRYQEKSLKYGAEYEDYVKMEFGVRPRDSRLNKSEYLGGSQTILQISEVIQTADATDSPLGNQAGYSIGTARSRKIKYHCPEHGIILGLCSIRPETIYTQGIDRDLLKTERFEFWTREMVGIGAQEIKQQEIYATAENKDQIFGYDLNGNYREYYSKRSRVSGNFRTDLNFWHLGRFFTQPPALNSSFITMNPRKDIFAITDQTLPAFLCYFQNSALFYRPIPRKVKNKIS